MSRKQRALTLALLTSATHAGWLATAIATATGALVVLGASKTDAVRMVFGILGLQSALIWICGRAMSTYRKELRHD